MRRELIAFLFQIVILLQYRLIMIAHGDFLGPTCVLVLVIRFNQATERFS